MWPSAEKRFCQVYLQVSLAWTFPSVHGSSQQWLLCSKVLINPFLVSFDQPEYLPRLIAFTRQQEKSAEQRATRLTPTLQSQTTATKLDIKGDSKAEAGQAPAKYTLMVSQSSYYAEVLLTCASLLHAHIIPEIFNCRVRWEITEEALGPWNDSWPKVLQNNMPSFTGRIMESCRSLKTALASE